MASQQGKRDFGSFHSSNVQELISLSEEEYKPPHLPVEVPVFTELLTGRPCREKHFLLEEDCTFINHGAFGGVLKEALAFSQKCQEYTERQPLRFYDRELLPHMVYISRRLAKFVGCAPTDLVLVTNATTAINCVLRSLPITEKDTIYTLSTTYGAVKKLLQAVCDKTGAKLQEVKVQFPITSKEQIISLVDKTLDDAGGTRFAVFDHIPSNTPFILPLKEIINICKQRGVTVLIDGAHALGAIDLDLEDLDPDFYVSNAHKWFCCPKGSAFMYVKKDWQQTIRPLVISHGYGSGFNSEFIWAGLHDYSPFLALHVCLNFWENLQPKNIHQYMYSLCQKAGELLTKVWSTKLAACADMFGTMALVQLPARLYQSLGRVDYEAAETIQNLLYSKYNIEVPVKCVQEVLYVRISCHIYNELWEYEKLGQAVLELCDSSEIIPCESKVSKSSSDQSNVK